MSRSRRIGRTPEFSSHRTQINARAFVEREGFTNFETFGGGEFYTKPKVERHRNEFPIEYATIAKIGRSWEVTIVRK